jgi:hypothetical protein
MVVPQGRNGKGPFYLEAKPFSGAMRGGTSQENQSIPAKSRQVVGTPVA